MILVQLLAFLHPLLLLGMVVPAWAIAYVAQERLTAQAAARRWARQLGTDAPGRGHRTTGAPKGWPVRVAGHRGRLALRDGVRSDTTTVTLLNLAMGITSAGLVVDQGLWIAGIDARAAAMLYGFGLVLAATAGLSVRWWRSPGLTLTLTLPGAASLRVRPRGAPPVPSLPDVRALPTGDTAFDARVDLAGQPEEIGRLSPDVRDALDDVVDLGGELFERELTVPLDPRMGHAAFGLHAAHLATLARELGEEPRGAIALQRRVRHDPVPGVRRRALDALLDRYPDAGQGLATVIVREAGHDPHDVRALVAALGTDEVVTRAALACFVAHGFTGALPRLAAHPLRDGPLADAFTATITALRAQVGDEAAGRVGLVGVAAGGLSAAEDDARGGVDVADGR